MCESNAKETYSLNLLEQSWAKWKESAVLRAYYKSLYDDMVAPCKRGRILEVGSGIGVSRDFAPDITTSDIRKTRFVDRAISCYDIPKNEDWTSIVAMDVLHHVRTPFEFLRSASHALPTGGRIVIMEPAATLCGRLMYGLCHHEPMVPSEVQPPFVFKGEPGNADFANMAMAQGIFHSFWKESEHLLTDINLKLVSITYRDVLAYFLTGGFSRPALISQTVLNHLLKLEGLLPQTSLSIIGLRMRVVLERIGTG
jgi:SAM-dependent methyltransferase